MSIHARFSMASRAARFVAVATLLAAIAPADAQTEPLGGRPASGAAPSVPDIKAQVAYQRAFEAVVWSQPAVMIHRIRQGMFEALGIGDNDVVAMSRPLMPRHEFLTGNASTPYIFAASDLRRGPLVIEVPPATDRGALFGQVVGAWQENLADIGPSGSDRGKGGRYLFLPPGHAQPVPDGYFAVRATSHRIVLVLRSIRLPGMSDADAHAYAKSIRIYPLADAASPQPTRFVDGWDRRISTLPFYDLRYFGELHDIVSAEPPWPRDKVMMGMLASIGIEPGKPFTPSPEVRVAMERAVVDAYFYMQQRFYETQARNLWWPDRHWSDFMITDADRGFTFETPAALLVDARSDIYHNATLFPAKLPVRPAVIYLVALADSQGRALEAGRTYRLRIPKDVPAKQFWSLIVYDDATKAFIDSPLQRVGLSSYDRSAMKLNDDGSVDLWFGPKPPAGLDSNWIPTAGKRPIPCLRVYGGEDAFFDRSFKLPDPERID